jgi:hypothetical protein
VDHRDDLLSKKAASKTELLHKTEKQTVNCNKTQRVEGEGGKLSLFQRKGMGQRNKPSVLNFQ